MIVQQAYYGEVNRGHSCIHKTFDNPDLTSHLISFTDRPAALPPDVVLKPYYSGMAWMDFYIYTKTFSDPYATRAGMVFTHVLIINRDELKNINNLDDIFSHFIDLVPKTRTVLEPLYISVSDINIYQYNKFQPLFIKEVIHSLIYGNFPILFSGEIDSIKQVIQKIWNGPYIEFRNSIKYRASFTPSDIEGVNDLKLVSIQNEFIPKWTDKNMIISENNELVEITSQSEAFFLGSKENNLFYSFLIDLNVNQNNFSNFGLIDRVFNDYNAVDEIKDANVIRLNIRILSKISPFAEDGIRIKDKFIDLLIELMDSEIDNNFKALRNIEWSVFKNGEYKIKQLISAFIKKELFNPHIQLETLTELIELSCSEEKKNWWHYTIQESFSNVFRECNKIEIENIWKLIINSDKIINIIFTLIPNSNEFEILLRNNMPKIISENTFQILEHATKQKELYLLHADLLLTHMSIESAILNHLELESNLTLKDSNSLKYLVSKLNDKQLVSFAELNNNDKLIKISVERVSKNITLLNDLNVNSTCWLNIWSYFLIETRNLSKGIESKEKEIVFSILDLTIDDKYVPEIIIELIADSSFADISNYKNREQCWIKIPHKFVTKFINRTAIAIIEKFLLDEISIDSIEKPLLEHISSVQFITNLLVENQNDIKPIMKIQESFSILNDFILSDYIKIYSGSISNSDANQLGSLVYRETYILTAKAIYEKSKYNWSFKYALEQCKKLVPGSVWAGVWKTKKKGKKNIDFNDYANSLKMKETLPTIIILTAIQEEYMAVRNHLINILDADQNSTGYEVGVFEYAGKRIAKVIIRECGQKNTNASQETERAIHNFSPDCIFFVGIAGSRKPKDFDLGDVIFPEKIYSYEGGKAEKDNYRARPDFADCDYTLLEISKKERNKEDWKKLIKGKWSKDVKANIGIIASGDQIVEHFNSDIGKILTEHFNDASVVEMEGFGFAKAAKRQGRKHKNMIVGVVRGISDIIGQPQDTEAHDLIDKRPINAKSFAADTAAAFAYWLIFKNYGNND